MTDIYRVCLLGDVIAAARSRGLRAIFINDHTFVEVAANCPGQAERVCRAFGGVVGETIVVSGLNGSRAASHPN